MTPVRMPAHVFAAVREGHTFEDDPPHGLSSVSRWTCTTCGDAVLDSGSVVYGTATQRTCAESVALWGSRS
jgi:hypothetical protein